MIHILIFYIQHVTSYKNFSAAYLDGENAIASNDAFLRYLEIRKGIRTHFIKLFIKWANILMKELLK